MCGITSAPSHSVLTGFNYSAALSAVPPDVLAHFGPVLQATVLPEFQKIAASVMAEDFEAVRRLSQNWHCLFDSLGAAPLAEQAARLEGFAEQREANAIARQMGSMKEELLLFYVALSAALEVVNIGLHE
jgi:hypothetical protein